MIKNDKVILYFYKSHKITNNLKHLDEKKD